MDLGTVSVFALIVMGAGALVVTAAGWVTARQSYCLMIAVGAVAGFTVGLSSAFGTYTPDAIYRSLGTAVGGAAVAAAIPLLGAIAVARMTPNDYWRKLDEARAARRERRQTARRKRP